MTPLISAAINTWNEERNLPRALRSIRSWVDEIVVVDMHSDDRTVEIAKSFGAHVHVHERLGFADPARAFAIEQTRGSWVLILDADELVPHPLSMRLTEIAREARADVVQIPRRNYLLGAELKHTGWGLSSDYQMRFFRRGALHTTATIHDFLKPALNARLLRLPPVPELSIVHFNYLDIGHFLEKLNRYTTIEARQAAERGETSSVASALAKALSEFCSRYVGAGGYRDGWRGFYLSALMAFYRLSAAGKLTELVAGVTPERTERLYADVAERVLAEYEVQHEASRHHESPIER
jgi:glycosyltransferase involved in cell wall biosynthesis